MRKLFLTSVFLAGANAAFAQPANLGANNQTAPELWYKYELDLTNPKNDLLEVSLLTPKFGKKDSAVFALPRMVPGTYSVYDFSRFVSEFKAFNARGKELKVVRSEDGQSWKVKKPRKLAKITYKIEDTWDTDKTNFIFEPAGTNIAPIRCL
jgi:predicted metalloprotease with PDZ domain